MLFLIFPHCSLHLLYKNYTVSNELPRLLWETLVAEDIRKAEPFRMRKWETGPLILSQVDIQAEALLPDNLHF